MIVNNEYHALDIPCWFPVAGTSWSLMPVGSGYSSVAYVSIRFIIGNVLNKNQVQAAQYFNVKYFLMYLIVI